MAAIHCFLFGGCCGYFSGPSRRLQHEGDLVPLCGAEARSTMTSVLDPPPLGEANRLPTWEADSRISVRILEVLEKLKKPKGVRYGGCGILMTQPSFKRCSWRHLDLDHRSRIPAIRTSRSFPNPLQRATGETTADQSSPLLASQIRDHSRALLWVNTGKRGISPRHLPHTRNPQLQIS